MTCAHTQLCTRSVPVSIRKLHDLAKFDDPQRKNRAFSDLGKGSNHHFPLSKREDCQVVKITDFGDPILGTTQQGERWSRLILLLSWQLWFARDQVLGAALPWQKLQTLVIVESTRQLWNKTTHEFRFFISSLEVTNQQFADYIRSHWGIENQLHWCLDVVFGEDDSRIRQGHSARNMSLMRRFTLNLLRQENSNRSLTMKRYMAAMDNNFLIKILADSGFI